MAGYKMISMGLLIVLVALAAVSPVFASDGFTLPMAFDPPAACPGALVTVTFPQDDVVGGGMSVAAVSPLGASQLIFSSSPAGLFSTNPECDLIGSGTCTLVVSESASCGLSYGVTATIRGGGEPSFSGQFDVTCCPVGGCVQPVSTFALLSPWLLAIGLIGCIGTVVVVAKKRES